LQLAIGQARRRRNLRRRGCYSKSPQAAADAGAIVASSGDLGVTFGLKSRAAT